MGGVVLREDAAAKDDRHNWPAAHYRPTEMDFPLTGFIAMTNTPSIARINPPELGTPPAAPAVTLVEVSKLYGPDFLIEIEAIAAV